MNKEFTTYEQALALKELGFNDKCFGYYRLDRKDNQFKLIQSHCSDGFYNFDELCLTPLYQQAFRWFREKYDLSSWISGRNTMGFSYTIDSSVGNFVYNTYEEAESACLDKLIEIVRHTQS